MTITIRDATHDDVELVTEILTAGFTDDPVSAWLVDDPGVRPWVLGGYFRLFVHHGLKVGTVHLADQDAAAVWFPHNAPDAVDLEDALQRVCGTYSNRFTAFGRVMREHHPTGTPHDYLMLLATHPKARNRGLGAALLAHRHAQLDEAGIPTYLEATTRRSAQGLYRRAGYQAHGNPITFPGGLAVYPQWREPRGDA
jgi:ribosomal protein S18 acetylase RimI-like enzyme